MYNLFFNLHLDHQDSTHLAYLDVAVDDLQQSIVEFLPVDVFQIPNIHRANIGAVGRPNNNKIKGFTSSNIHYLKINFTVSHPGSWRYSCFFV
jgi:hypothetical protein